MEIKKPIYFVCGNHCFWQSSIKQLTKIITDFCKTKKDLYFLDTSPVLKLTDKTAIIGHTGWYDLINGNVDKSYFWPNGFPDFSRIGEFLGMSSYFKKQICGELTTDASKFLEDQLLEAFRTYETVVLGTHVPPYREASWHAGKISDDHGAPFFSNYIMGEKLNQVMALFPNKKLIVLAGHTHSSILYQPKPNIDVHVAAAEYGSPSISQIFEIE